VLFDLDLFLNNLCFIDKIRANVVQTQLRSGGNMGGGSGRRGDTSNEPQYQFPNAAKQQQAIADEELDEVFIKLFYGIIFNL
jgi:hypothetical protein